MNTDIKTEAKKAADKVAAKTAEVKETVTTKVPEVAAKAADTTKKTVKKAAKAATTTAKKTAKKATTAAKKTADKAATVKTKLVAEVFIQYQNKEITAEDIVGRIKAAYEAEGKKSSAIKSLQVYVKPEENAAYYVINMKNAGKVNLY